MKTLPFISSLLLTVLLCVPVLAQHTDSTANHEHSEIDEIATAVLPLPESYRDGATILGYDESGAIVVKREGGNGLFCLADKPGDDRFQAVCYHESLEPFMARGRELRAQGLTGRAVLDKRHEEIDAGLLQAPTAGSILYNMMMDLDEFNPETAVPALYAIYTPYATEETTGLSTQPPAPGAPWIMRAGTASAHIMVVIPGKHDH